MTQSEFFTYKEQTFDAFSKTILRNESASLFRALLKKNRRELNFSSIPDETPMSLQSYDTYQPELTVFWVRGNSILIKDWALAQAFHGLHPHKREAILLSYFLDESDPQIGRLLHLSPTTIHYRRQSGLAHLKSCLEALDDENTELISYQTIVAAQKVELEINVSQLGTHCFYIAYYVGISQ